MRAVGGGDLSGGRSGGASNRGAIFRHHLVAGTTELVLDLDGAINGGQAYDGFLRVGDAWYFTTFTGGSTFGGPGTPLGAGTLSRMTFDEGGTAVVTRVIDLPAGYTQFPANTPVLYGTNAIYFTTVGPNSSPGALVRYELDSGTWTSVFTFVTNAANSTMYGKQPGYNGLTVWQDKIYYMTRQGGSNNTGVIGVYDVTSNTVTKLADLTGANGLALGRASGSYNTGTVVEWDERFYLYYPVPLGGTNDRGTILRLPLDAPPVQATALLPDEGVGPTLSWEGGYAPFVLQRCTDLNQVDWTNVVEGVTNRFVTLPLDGDAAIFRVMASPQGWSGK